jgi:hypothetical protein
MNPSNSETFNHPLLLETEEFRFGIDSIKGTIDYPDEAGIDSILLTNLRVLKLGRTSESVTSTAVPIQQITSIDVVKVTKSNAKLLQSFALMLVGVSLSALSWLLLDVMAITIILGGLPTLAGIYLFSGWAIPDAKNELILYSNQQAISQSLQTKESELAAHQFLLNFYSDYFATNSIARKNILADDSGISISPNSTFGGTSTANPLENAILSNLRKALPSSNNDPNPSKEEPE